MGGSSRGAPVAAFLAGLVVMVGVGVWLRPAAAPRAHAQDQTPKAAAKADWEFIGDEKDVALMAVNRLRVPGGWLVASEDLAFIPDPDHAWAATKKVAWKKDVPATKMPGWGRVARIDRTEVPGGWLLAIFVPGDSHVLFYPDAEHAWTP